MQLKCLSLGLGLASLVVLTNQVAHAETNIIKDPDRHPHYVFEAEPHFLLAPLGNRTDGPISPAFGSTRMLAAVPVAPQFLPVWE